MVSIAEPLTAIPLNSVMPATQEKLGHLEQAGEKKRDKRSGNRGAATRRSYTAEFKLMVLQAAADTSPAAAARKYKVSASNISKWAKTSELQCGGAAIACAHTHLTGVRTVHAENEIEARSPSARRVTA